jgi:hypothetical protein
MTWQRVHFMPFGGSPMNFGVIHSAVTSTIGLIGDQVSQFGFLGIGLGKSQTSIPDGTTVIAHDQAALMTIAIVAFVAFDEVLDAGRHVSKLQVATPAKLFGDIFGDVA